MTIFNFMIGAGESAQSSSMLSSPWAMTVIMVGFIAFFYFVVVRPQNKKKKEMDVMLKALKKGDKVVSIGGIHGKIVSMKENTITIRVDSNAEITFDKSAISKVAEETAGTKQGTAAGSAKK